VSTGGGALRVSLGGTAAIYCVHDREKRLVRTEDEVARLGLEVGIVYDRNVHRLFDCSCCENLFWDAGEEARFCHACRGPTLHLPGGALPEPRGRID
jgi:hypothetical protein